MSNTIGVVPANPMSPDMSSEIIPFPEPVNEQFNKFSKSLLLLKSVREKNDNFCVWPFYNHFWPLFCQLHKYLSQTLESDGHFEGLNMWKSQLDQNLWHKLQMFLACLFFNFGRKKFKYKCFKNCHFFTICGLFLATA